MTEAAYVRDIPALLEPLTSAGPLTAAVMVASVDGRATVGGRVGELTGGADQRVLLGAREHAAAVVVGGRTVRAEGYEGLLGDDAKARRQARRLPPEPELVVFTRASPSPPELMRQLRERHPDRLIVCEGGPTLLGLLVEHRLLDQLVLCVSPQIVGDDAQKRLLSHSGALGVDLRLLAATAAEGFLFLRYRLG
ncbi:MAG TPA: dihydrofolate reductase family protein [Solirubrobacteraceae bacterium]|nr:dihydrofolate reductase family protein [Solirubrobacteraceae bacterium]